MVRAYYRRDRMKESHVKGVTTSEFLLETASHHERHESESDFEGAQHILSVATYPSVPAETHSVGYEIKDFLDCQITRYHR